MNVKDKIGKCFNNEANWFEFYGEVKEEVLANAPESLGKGVDITGYVDADHTGDQLTRRSHNGINIFFNSTPIVCHSKRHTC